LTWFKDPLGGTAAPILRFVLIALVVVVATLAHVPLRMPGPVARQERAAASGTRSRRLSGWSLTLGAVAGLLGCLSLLLVPMRPETIVLASRARGSAPDLKPETSWVEVTDESASDAPQRRERREPCDDRPSRIVDLGPTVDAALESFRDFGGSLPSADERERARDRYHERRKEELQTVSDVDAWGFRRSSLPAWVVESVEVSEIIDAVRSRNVRTVIIAPGETSTPSSFRVLARILARRGVRVCFVDERIAEGDAALSVSHISLARVADDGSLTFWALVDGHTEQSVSMRTLTFRVLHKGLSIQSPRVVVPVDKSASRLVLACVGPTCPRGAVVASPPDLVAPRFADEVRRDPSWAVSWTDAAGRPRATAPISLLSAEKRQVQVVLVGGGSERDALARLLDPGGRLAREKSVLSTELESLGLTMPTLAPSKDGVRVFVQLDQNGLLVAGEQESLPAANAWRTRHLSRRGTVGPNVRVRVSEDRLGPATLTSWLQVAPLGQLQDDPIFAASDGQVVASSRDDAPVDAPFQPRGSIVAVVDTPQPSPGQGRGVPRFASVLLDGRYSARWDKDAFVAMPLIRTLAWAIRSVTPAADDEELVVRDDRVTRALAGPLSNVADTDQLERDTLRWPHLIAGFVLGGYLVLILRGRARATVPGGR
jgi:hypothetical protein